MSIKVYEHEAHYVYTTTAHNRYIHTVDEANSLVNWR